MNIKTNLVRPENYHVSDRLYIRVYSKCHYIDSMNLYKDNRLVCMVQLSPDTTFGKYHFKMKAVVFREYNLSDYFLEQLENKLKHEFVRTYR